MSGVYHERGFWRGLLRPGGLHAREYVRNPRYRALHRFHRELRHMPRFAAAEVVFDGRRIRICDAPSFLSAWDEIFVNRIYEIAANADAVPTLVDAGANIGLAALFWKWRYGHFKYMGYEPDPIVAACCRENLRTWDVDGVLIEAAVGASDGTAHFRPDGADGGRLSASGEGASTELHVVVKRLASVLPPRVDLLKIDVEGAESEVLADIGPSLHCVRALFVEWHSRSGNRGLGDAITGLEAAGFDCYVQVAIGPSRPFLYTPSRQEFSQNLNLYAIRP